MDIGSLIGSVLSGGATGIIGVAVQRIADYKNKQLDLQLEKQRAADELAKRQVDAAIVKEESAAKVQVAMTEGEAAKDVAASNAFASTMWKEPQRYSDAAKLSAGQQWVMVGLDALRGIVRPGLTIYLCALTTYVWYQVRMLMGEAHIDPAAALDVWKLVVQTILYLTTTVVLWWFGTRNRQPQPKL